MYLADWLLTATVQVERRLQPDQAANARAHVTIGTHLSTGWLHTASEHINSHAVNNRATLLFASSL